ncbi:MAG: Ldh family oxidoreductase [Microbacterium sp.]|uniref:Ldh family oxidoreductase n=1 Tax=Microbacterium sp. TaxID=51671 RepID=UPI0039E33E66
MTESTITRISFDDLVAAMEAELLDAGIAPEGAAILARHHAACERDGALSHGVFRVLQYRSTVAAGHLDGAAEPRVEQVSSAYIRVDARGGLAVVAQERARESILRAIEQEGVAVVAIRNSHHHGALWPDLEPFAEAGLVAVTMVTGGVPVVAPAGVHEPVLSTNPFAFGIPVEGSRPFVADFATSSMSFGDLTLRARAGKHVPLGTGVDAQGDETTDAAAIADGGILLPFGGHKGAALSIMVEMLASGLTGGDFSLDAVTKKPDGAHTSRTGQFLLVIDPDRGLTGDFAVRIARFVQLLRDAGMERLPADHRYQARDAAEAAGIPVSPAIRTLLGD